MNVAVFGWYHHRNAGDDRMQACLTRRLDGHTLAFLPAGRPPPVELLRTYDAAIVGGGGLAVRAGGMFRGAARWVRRAGIPVALVGISVEGDDPTLLTELRELVGASVFAWFRDRGSLDAVGQHPKAFVAPDLTWLYPLEAAPPSGDGLAVALRLRRGLDVAGWGEALASTGLPLRPWPFLFAADADPSLLRDVFRRAGAPCDTPEEFSDRPARHAAAVVSSRFHGLVFALQLGRPVVAVVGSPKVRRFVADLDLEHCAVDEDRPGDFPVVWRRLAARLDEAREEARALSARLHDEVWERTEPAFDRLLAEAEGLPSPRRRPRNRIRRLLDLGRWL